MTQANTSSLTDGIKTAHWAFDATVTEVFDDHVRQSVPLYEEIHRLIADMSCWFVEDKTNIYDIGTSTGETIANLSAIHQGKDLQYIGVDSSESMFKKAKDRFKDRSDVQIRLGDATDYLFSIRNASFVTSVLTMQFIPHESRAGLIQKIYNGMRAGGGFILVEKVIGSTPRFDQMYVELYHELKLKNGLSLDHVMNKARSLRGVQRPNTIEENREMLKEAGFKDIDIFFKWSNFTAFIATK